jgi:hypothetical protein
MIEVESWQILPAEQNELHSFHHTLFHGGTSLATAIYCTTDMYGVLMHPAAEQEDLRHEIELMGQEQLIVWLYYEP